MKQVTFQPAPAHMDLLKAFWAWNGALIRFANHRHEFVDEPLDLQGKSYIVISGTQLINMYGVVEGDSIEKVTARMNQTHNEFFKNLSDQEAELFKQAKSQQQLETLSCGKVEMKPHIGMVREQLGKCISRNRLHRIQCVIFKLSGVDGRIPPRR